MKLRYNKIILYNIIVKVSSINRCKKSYKIKYNIFGKGN